MKISLIAALSKNYVIGCQGKLPWTLKKDLAHFRALTLGKPVLMGRKTFESIGRALPKRRNIVLTRDLNFKFEGVEIVHDLQEAVKLLESLESLKVLETWEDPEIMIIGGEQIYQLFLPIASKLYLTQVDAEIANGDAFFPEFNKNLWKLSQSEFYGKDAENDHDCVFTEWVKS